MTGAAPGAGGLSDVESCNVCRYVRPARTDANRLVCRRYAPRSEWRTGVKLLSVPLVQWDDWCGEFDPRPAPAPAAPRARPSPGRSER